MLKYLIISVLGLLSFIIGFIIQKIIIFQKCGFIVLFSLCWHWSLLLYIGIIIAGVGILGMLMYEE